MASRLTLGRLASASPYETEVTKMRSTEVFLQRCFDPARAKRALLTPGQVADRLGVSRRTLAKWRSNRLVGLAYVKLGARVFYRVDDVENFIAAHVVDPARECGNDE